MFTHFSNANVTFHVLLVTLSAVETAFVVKNYGGNKIHVSIYAIIKFENIKMSGVDSHACYDDITMI